MPSAGGRRIIAASLLALLLVQPACIGPQRELSPSVKSRIDTVAVQALTLQPHIREFTPALTRREAASSEAGHYAAMAAAAPLLISLIFLQGCHSEECLATAGIGLGGALVCGLLGGLYGSARGALHEPTPPDIAAERQENLHEALAGLVVQQEFAAAFLAVAAEKSPYRFVLLNDPDSDASSRRSETRASPPAANARLEMAIVSFGIDGSAAEETRLRFTLNARTHFFLPPETPLLEREYGYRSPPYAHGRWAADNGRLLREELARGYRAIAEEMIADMFD